MKIQNSGFLSIEQLQDQYLNQNKSAASNKIPEGKSFLDILESSREKTADEVKFSKHAAGRLADR